MRSRSALIVILAALVAGVAAAGPAGSGYDKPPQNVLDVLHAPSPPNPFLSPTRDRILLVSWVEYPPIAQVAEPFLKLAGVRVEPRTRRKHDTPGGYGVAPCAQTLTLVDVSNSREIPVTLPPDGCVDGIVWAADGRRFAFRNTSQDAVELWIGDAATGAIRRLGDARLNPMLGSSLQWMPDQKTLLVKLVPANAGPPPAAAVASDGPSIQETTGETGESSTYETRDTLSNKHDEDLFDYYATSQLALRRRGLGRDHAAGRAGDHHRGRPLARRREPPRRRRSTSRTRTSPRTPNFAHDVELWDRTGRRTAHAREAAPRGSRADRAACPPARATSSGGRPSRRRSSGPRRSTAATGTSASPRATRS